jgi:hypothetical protein
MLGLALVIGFGTAKANTPNDKKLTQNYAINTYIDAMTRGKMDGFSDVLDNTMKFSQLRGKNVLSYTKKEMLTFMETNKNVEQICTTSTSVVEQDSNVEVVKVNMNYNGFTRANYVTLANTGNGWKIVDVYSVFV